MGFDIEESRTMRHQMNNRGALPLVALLLVAVMVVGGGLYWLIARSSTSSSNNTVPTTTPVPTQDPYEGWQTYTNEEYGYSIMYPPNMKITTDGQGDLPLDELEKLSKIKMQLVGETQRISPALIDGLGMIVNYVKKPTNQSLEDFYITDNVIEISKEDIIYLKLAGHDAIYDIRNNFYSGVGMSAIYMVEKSETEIYIISGSYAGPDEAYYKEIYELVVNSFKFI